MGGTILKHVKNGHDVKIIFMATGIFARRSMNENSTSYYANNKTSREMKNELKKLRLDAKKAAKILGVKKLEFNNFPDNEMDTISTLQIIKKVEESLKIFDPNVVYTHSRHDLNLDHRIIHDATITATRPTKDCKVKEVISFEVPSSTEWNFPSHFSPNIFVDISKELKVKLKALNVYKKEVRKYPHPRSLKAIEIIAKHWGTVSGFTAAEAFFLVRQLKAN